MGDSLILYKKLNEEITPILTQCIWANDTNITKEIQNHIFCSSQDIDYELSNVRKTIGSLFLWGLM